MMVKIMIWTPVHLPMHTTATITPNCDESGLVGDSTRFIPAILKSQLRPICNKTKQVILMLFSNLCSVTWNYFTSVPAASTTAADDDNLVGHHCSMVIPLLAEKGIDTTR